MSKVLDAHRSWGPAITVQEKIIAIEDADQRLCRLDEQFRNVPTWSMAPVLEACQAMRGASLLVAVGIDWDGRRQILAVEMANRESRSAWKDFLISLKARGLKGVELVVSDDHAGLVAAIGEMIPAEETWRRLPAGTALAL